MGRLRWVLIVAVALAVAAGAAFFLLRGPAAVGPRPDQATPGPILLIPGYGGSRAALTQLADRLTAEGRATLVLTLPGDGTGDLAAQAGALDHAVREALAGGAPSVDLVGYSAGGVVARLWADRYAGAEVARRVVTLGSPLHGTRLAAAGAALAPGSCPQACRQLVPGSELLDDLDGAELPEGLPWLSVWTENDETVVPPDSARLAGAVNVPLQSLCPEREVMHGGLPTDDAVSALVIAALSGAALATPTACPV
jgi:triacylglycerol lipase